VLKLSCLKVTFPEIQFMQTRLGQVRLGLVSFETFMLKTNLSRNTVHYAKLITLLQAGELKKEKW
jgi:hypothetical protein